MNRLVNLRKYAPYFLRRLILMKLGIKQKCLWLCGPKTAFLKGIDYNLEIERSYIIYDRENSVLRKSEPEKILQKSFSIVKPAGVLEITPLGNDVLPGTAIKIKF